MGTEKVVAKIEVVPEGLDVDFETIKSKCKNILSKRGDVAEVIEKPMAFGMKALVFTATFEAGAGGLEAVEDALSKVKGVSRAEVIDVRKLM